jgi:hypothetical protein
MLKLYSFKITSFWVVTPYSLVDRYQHFEETYYVNLMGRFPEEGRQGSSTE